MTWTKRCLITTDAQRAYAQQLAAGVAGVSAQNMWVSGGCSPTGIAPATHWVNEGRVQSEFSGLLPFSTVSYDLAGVATVAQVSAGSAPTVFSVATANGFVTTLIAVQALFAVIDVTDQDPFVAMARLGLKMI